MTPARAETTSGLGNHIVQAIAANRANAAPRTAVPITEKSDAEGEYKDGLSSETLRFVNLEVMAAGCPLVASRWMGF